MAQRKPATKLPSDVVFRLGKVLALCKEEEGSFLGLAKKINDANGNPTPMVIDRRKLVRLVEGDVTTSLSAVELVALDRYLEPFGEGLSKRPLLERPSIMETLVERGEVTFLLGARPREDRVDHSNWDVQAMAEILRGTGGLHRVHFDIREVLLLNRLKQFRQAYPAGKRQPKGSWRSLLRDDGPSLVCCGSPRSCHASELLLAEMFGVEAFKKASGQHPRLPFHFVWGERATSEIPCRFEHTGKELAAKGHPLAGDVVSRGARILMVGDEDYLVERPGESARHTTYGVVAAQRRPGGQVWMVIAGLTGAATHGAARCAMEMHSSLPPIGKGRRRSMVYWGVVKSVAVRGRSKQMPPLRRVTSQEIIGDLRHYTP